jgi:hypothetical protein
LTGSVLSAILGSSLKGISLEKIHDRPFYNNLMADPKKSTPSRNKTISIHGDVNNSAVFIGDNNTVNQTIIQKFFNIFKSDAETLEQRNRRILLNHVENAWIKGVLDASLYGAAMLDLGIKETPKAITNKYPWTLKKESTDETLPAGTSMLEIFDSIGMGRSLLILGAPGSGKTTMLLELARGLIARAREDVTQPIPMVFNLASWTEKLTLADWLAQELNNLYSVPRKTAPDWVKGNRLLLLLDGLDEVRQESRAKCVEAINEFRKQNGLTSLTVCSRSQDYADLKAKLSFEGAIEVQPLTQKQITEFFNRFGKELSGIKQVLTKDSALREMAETPLFLSIMIMAYRDKQAVDIWISQDEKKPRRHLFDTYIERMFERGIRPGDKRFKRQDVVKWLSSLAHILKTFKYLAPFNKRKIIFDMISDKQQKKFIWYWKVFFGVSIGMGAGVTGGLIPGLAVSVLLIFFNTWLDLLLKLQKDRLKEKSFLNAIISWIITPFFLSSIFLDRIVNGGQILHRPRQILFSIGGFILAFLTLGVTTGIVFGVKVGIIGGLIGGVLYGSADMIQYFMMRLFMRKINTLPWQLMNFLDYGTDRLFLRKIGNGYIFIHQLLEDHFSNMYEGENLYRWIEVEDFGG